MDLAQVLRGVEGGFALNLPENTPHQPQSIETNPALFDRERMEREAKD